MPFPVTIQLPVQHNVRVHGDEAGGQYLLDQCSSILNGWIAGVRADIDAQDLQYYNKQLTLPGVTARYYRNQSFEQVNIDVYPGVTKPGHDTIDVLLGGYIAWVDAHARPTVITTIDEKTYRTTDTGWASGYIEAANDPERKVTFQINDETVFDGVTCGDSGSEIRLFVVSFGDYAFNLDVDNETNNKNLLLDPRNVLLRVQLRPEDKLKGRPEADFDSDILLDAYNRGEDYGDFYKEGGYDFRYLLFNHIPDGVWTDALDKFGNPGSFSPPGDTRPTTLRRKHYSDVLDCPLDPFGENKLQAFHTAPNAQKDFSELFPGGGLSGFNIPPDGSVPGYDGYGYGPEPYFSGRIYAEFFTRDKLTGVTTSWRYVNIVPGETLAANVDPWFISYAATGSRKPLTQEDYDIYQGAWVVDLTPKDPNNKLPEGLTRTTK